MDPLLTSLFGDDPTPEADTTLPSIDLAPVADLVDAPAGQMLPDPRPVPGRAHGKLHGIDVIHELAPLLLSAVAGIKNPTLGAAMASGYARGALAARQEKLAVDKRDADLRAQALRFQQQTASDVFRLKDPLERQRYLQYAQDIGTEHFGLPPGWTTRIPVPPSDAMTTMKTEIAAKLKAFDSDKRWQGVAGTPAEGKISFSLSNGQSVPVSRARQLVGQAVYDTATGQQAYGTPPEKEGTTDEAQYRRVLIQEFKEQHGGREPNTSELRQIYEDAKSGRRAAPAVGSFEDYLKRKYGDTPTPAQITNARREYGDASRAAPITVNIPGMTGMSPADRVESAAQDILNHRMAPSQLATFFTGMGRETASQLRSYVMARVKQLDPTFNFQAAEANYKFGSNTGTQNTVRYLESVQESIPLLLTRARTLNNGQVRGLNVLINAGKNQFNAVDLKQFQTDVLLVSDEVAKILQGGGTGSATSDAKLKQAGRILSESDSPAAIAGALEDINTLLGFRKKSLTKDTFLDDTTTTDSKKRLVYNPVTRRVEPAK